MVIRTFKHSNESILGKLPDLAKPISAIFPFVLLLYNVVQQRSRMMMSNAKRQCCYIQISVEFYKK